MSDRASIPVAEFKAEVARWAGQLGVKPAGVYVQRMTKKWASCSSNRRLCFSAELLEESPAFRTVVIVHELLHLSIPNHGPLFRSLMCASVPEWEKVARGRVARLRCFRERRVPYGGVRRRRRRRLDDLFR